MGLPHGIPSSLDYLQGRVLAGLCVHVRRPALPEVLPLDHERSCRLCQYPVPLHVATHLLTLVQMDQVPPPGPPVLFHVRVASILGLLAAADIILVSYSLDSILYEGVSAMVLFSSEFMILLAGAGGIAARYAVNLWDLRRARGREDAPVWEDKSVWMFYIDLAVGQCYLCPCRPWGLC